VSGGEGDLDVEPAHVRHMQIEHETIGFAALDRVQELGTGSKGLDGEAGRRHQSLQGKSHVRIVVHYGQPAAIASHRERNVSSAGDDSYWT
jgi:hypothetical protein